MTLVVRFVTMTSCSNRAFCRLNFSGDALTIAMRLVTKPRTVSALVKLSLLGRLSVFSGVTTDVTMLTAPVEFACTRTMKSRAVLLVNDPAVRERILVVGLKVDGMVGRTERNWKPVGRTL